MNSVDFSVPLKWDRDTDGSDCLDNDNADWESLTASILIGNRLFRLAQKYQNWK